jgi:hypothetical protein
MADSANDALTIFPCGVNSRGSEGDRRQDMSTKDISCIKRVAFNPVASDYLVALSAQDFPIRWQRDRMIRLTGLTVIAPI